MVFPPQIDNFADDPSGGLPGVALRSRGLLGKSNLPMLVVFLLPPIKGRPTQAKIAAGHAGITDLLGMFKYTQATLYFPHFRSHGYSFLK